MFVKWEDVTRGYFNREKPYTLPIFDDFGLDEDGSYYYDLAPLGKAERDAREASIARIILEVVADNKVYGNAKTMYLACPITSGLYASEWVAKHNQAAGYEPNKIITTTHKLARHMGSEMMGEIVTKPNVRDNLLRGAIAIDALPDHHPLMPVVREMVVKHMTQNNDYSAGQRYEDVDFMAKWYIKIDQCASLVMDGPLTFSRSTDKEIMRALLVQAGLHPNRPDADMDIHTLDGQQANIIDIYEKMFETVRYQVGSGIVPKEAALVVARMGDIFDHLRGKENKISAAREAAGMSKFPEKMHPSMQKLVTQDAPRFERIRAQAESFIKTYCLEGLERGEIDDKYESWYQQGFGRAPSYTDGMVASLRKKLEMLEANAEDVETFFRHAMPHRDTLDGPTLSQKKGELVDLIQLETSTFNLIRPNNNGHWNPRLAELREIVQTNTRLASDLDGASPTNYERLIKIAGQIKENSHRLKNEVRQALNDQTIPRLRAEAREIAKKNLTLSGAVTLKPASADAKAAMRIYSDHSDPFSGTYESSTFGDSLFEQLSDREKALIPPLLGAMETVYPSKNQPYSASFSLDPKTFGSNGDKRKQNGVQGVKNIYGAAGADSLLMTQSALDYAEKARAYIEKLRPGKIVHGTPDDIALYNAVAKNPKAVAKTGGGARPSSASRLLLESKFTQLRDDEVFFAPGWERSEHEVQKRVNGIKIQLGLLKRDHGTQLKIYTLPENLDKAPANPQPDSLYESIVPLARFVKEEFEAGRKVPPAVTLGLIRLLEVHAMLMDPKLLKRIPDEKERFDIHGIESSLIAYLRDDRKEKLGAINGNTDENALYPYLADRYDGLLFEPEILRELSQRAVEDPALGENYKEGLKDARGVHAAHITQKTGEDTLHVSSGLNI